MPLNQVINFIIKLSLKRKKNPYFSVLHFSQTLDFSVQNRRRGLLPPSCSQTCSFWLRWSCCWCPWRCAMTGDDKIAPRSRDGAQACPSTCPEAPFQPAGHSRGSSLEMLLTRAVHHRPQTQLRWTSSLDHGDVRKRSSQRQT